MNEKRRQRMELFGRVSESRERAREKREFNEFWKVDDTKFQSGSKRKVGGKATGRMPNYYPKTGPTQEDVEWRLTVLTRDGFRCVVCGSRDQLEADHIRPKHLYPELRHIVGNGRTLCKPCHKKTPTWGSKVRKLVSVRVEEPEST